MPVIGVGRGACVACPSDYPSDHSGHTVPASTMVVNSYGVEPIQEPIHSRREVVMKVLIAGGAGFIGSTVASAAMDHGYTPVILDNMVTGRREFCSGRIAYHGDIGDRALIDRVFADNPDIETVVHCAGLAVVSDSVRHPLQYYRENVAK